MPLNAGLVVEAATGDDALALAALERRCYTNPWTPRHFTEALGDPHQVVLLARDPGERGAEGRGIAGYCVVSCVADEAEVHNVATAPDRRRRGLARLLLDVGLRLAARRGARAALLEVRAGNQAARALYGAAGFRVVGTRRGYYRDPPEDAVVMRMDGLEPPRARSFEP